MIRTMEDLRLAVEDADRRYELFRKKRLSEIRDAISRALIDQPDNVADILNKLSDIERDEVYRYFPEILNESRISSIEDSDLVLRRAALVLSNRNGTSSPNKNIDLGDIKLSRVAFSVANAPVGRVADLSNKLSVMDEGPKTLLGTIGFWIIVRSRKILKGIFNN